MAVLFLPVIHHKNFNIQISGGLVLSFFHPETFAMIR